jgi:parallel beta-helix repeat protein
MVLFIASIFGCAKMETAQVLTKQSQVSLDSNRIKSNALSSSKKYYVDPSSTSTTSNGTLLYPFKTIAQVNNTALYAGDSVFFKRGQIFTGRLYISKSGTVDYPIVFTNYGTSALLPIFDNTISNVVTIANANYVVLNGIKIVDNTMSVTDHSIQAKISYAIILNNASYCTISNCDISLVGVGVELAPNSNYNTIKKNSITNLRMVRNTPTTINANDDFGANGLVVESSNNIITGNKFEDCWANSYDYVFDGGAVELYGTAISNNRIAYNTISNSCGFVEVGSSTNGICDNTVVAYNKIINSAGSGTFQTSGTFAVKISNFQYYNNNFVETVKQFTMPSVLFYSSLKTPPTGMVVLKNNIFWLSSGVNIFPSYFNNSAVVHSNNIFRLALGTVGLTLNTSELLSSSLNLFTNTAGLPTNWDYTLLTGTPPINFGTNVGIGNDFNGNPIISNPDAGILEKY